MTATALTVRHSRRSVAPVPDQAQADTPLIDAVLPLEQAAEAHRRLEAGGVRGKIILHVD